LFTFVTGLFFTVRSWYPQAQPPSWRTTPYRLSATAYSIYSELPSKTGGRSNYTLRPENERVSCLFASCLCYFQVAVIVCA
jgi:hypothetical protein